VGVQHADRLYAALCGPDNGALWTYRLEEAPGSVAGLAAALARAEADPDAVTYAIVAPEQGPCGLATLMRCDPEVEVGSILYAPSLQRTRAATEAMVLLGRHVFEALGYRRYEWKCDSLNAPSRVAAQRLGFTYEGTFRQAVVYKGRNRDTAWFSITDDEWPALRAAYDAWLDPDNFDEGLTQRTSLSRLVAELKRPSDSQTGPQGEEV
jgi:RimJ/RimL family protein N-acetyltransferase